MNNALHRFDSECKPAARCVWYFQAVCATMSHVARVRKSADQGKKAMKWIREVDSEKSLQLGMMVDSSDEIISVLRNNEPELFDESKLRSLLATLKDRLRSLFWDELCWNSGFAKVMIDILGSDCSLACSDGSVKALG